LISAARRWRMFSIISQCATIRDDGWND